MTISIGDLLEPTNERLGKRKEPEVLTLTEKNGFVSQRERFSKRLATENTSAYKVVRRFDIAFNPYLLWAGAVAQNLDWEEAIISPVYPTFRVRNGYEPRLVDRLLRSPQMVARYESIAFGSVPRRRRTSVDDFLSLRIGQLPAFPEQRRIADILDKADAIRRNRKEAIVLNEELLRSTFLELFGDPVTNPKGWPSETIEELCSRGGNLVDGPFGSSLKPELYVDSGVKVVRNCNIYDDRFDSSEFKHITAAKFIEIRRSEVIEGDVLITTKGTVGDVCVAPDLGGPAVLSASGTARLRLPLDRTYLPEFVVAQMTTASYKRYLHTFEAGSAQQYLNLSAIKKMRLIRPPIDRQHDFSRVKTRSRMMGSRFEAAQIESEHLFQSLLDQSFAVRS